MKQYAGSLVFFLMFSFPVAALCSVATQESEQAKPEARPGMGADVVTGVTGKVVETKTSGDYTYVNLEKDGKKVWAAFPVMTFTVGQEISAIGCTPMMNFQSKALNRTFDKIMFCNAPLKPAEAELLKKKSLGSNVAAPVSSEKIVIAEVKGENVYTVAQCYAQSVDLDKKPVTVKGKVLKVSTGIMGRNWIHVQDGTGDASRKTNNLVVTSKDVPKVGDIVTVTGTLFRNKDFGSGYKYNVIVEQATIKK
ncbi:MAG: OB-fold nucleic acid binding domain-containing protein [Desulfuromonadales bacterium]